MKAAEVSRNVPPVSLEQVTRVYDERVVAVRQVTLEIRSGEVFCLLGPNGAGKSTLLKMTTGVLPPTSGRVLIEGFDVSTATEAERAVARRSLGYMPERAVLQDRLTPREYLEFIGELCGRGDRSDLRRRIEAELDALRMGDKADARIGSLSHGMRRKVAFISAQLHDPRLLLLDEPTVGLDPASARLVKDRLCELRDAGRAVVMTTHVLEIAERLADRIGVLDHGSLLFVGTLAEMRAAARRPGASLEDLFLSLTEPGAEGVPELSEADPSPRHGTESAAAGCGEQGEGR
jgi:ABC-2 type transport system ATP-binding protein